VDTDMIEFIRARLDELERVAREFDWAPRNHYEVTEPEASPEYTTVLMPPDLLLADAQAKGRILDALAAYVAQVPDWDDFPTYDRGYVEGLQRAVAELAAPFARHPDYRASWGPQPIPGTPT
jgi:hypothetical protein